MSNVIYNKRLSVGLTDKMDDLLEDLAIARSRKGHPVTKSDLIREALRQYLEEQPDARGSRKQITKSLEAQLEALAAQITELAEGQTAQQEYLVRLGRALGPVIELANARTQKPRS
jgi:metal-responsive CopG/Arc/MetJ family transcriptional regulator